VVTRCFRMNAAVVQSGRLMRMCLADRGRYGRSADPARFDPKSAK
jgi:hypothetical protein